MVSRQLDECTKDPTKEDEIISVIKEAIELMNTQVERDYLKSLLETPADNHNLIESCLAA